jgi:Methane oxygenase PmoA
MKPVFALLFAAAMWALPASAQVKIAPGGQKLSVEIDGKPFTDFYVAGTAFGAEVTKPYLWPLRAPSGTYVTRMWPMENVAEEQKTLKDHQHQRGLWFAHDTVNKLDFWNNEASYKTPNRGRITLKKMAEVKSGKDRGSIAATFDWTNMEGSTSVLTERRVMTFYAGQPNRVFDIEITLTANQAVTFGDGKDGVLGIRMRPVLQEIAQKIRGGGVEEGVPGTGHITNADGLAGEKEVWGKPSKWCDYSGDVNGEKVGIAILDHPDNPRHPVRWHVRGYGLFAANPWGLAVFTNDKSQDGSMTVEPGKSLRYRYRVIIHPGDATSADLAAQWSKFAAGK